MKVSQAASLFFGKLPERFPRGDFNNKTIVICACLYLSTCIYAAEQLAQQSVVLMVVYPHKIMHSNINCHLFEYAYYY